MNPALTKNPIQENAGANNQQTPASDSAEGLSLPQNQSRRDFLASLVAAGMSAMVADSAVAEQVERLNPGRSGSQSSQVWLKVFDAANAALRQERADFSGEWKLSEDPLDIATKLRSSGDHLARVSAIDGYTLRATAGFGNDAIKAVNALFAEHQLNARLTQRAPSYNGLVSGAIEDIKFPFEQKGRVVIMKIADSRYEGVAKKDPTFFRSPSLTEPVVGLPTSNGVGLLMFKASAVAGLNSENVLKHSRNILNALKQNAVDSRTFQGGVHFPKVDFRATSEPTWLIGAKPEGMNVSIDEAVLETRFRLDENGGESTTGAAVATSRGVSIKKPYVIDEPFVVITYDKNQPTTILNATLVTQDAFVRADSK